jgi:transcriptional regulator with XRE-family HTH domain
MDNRDFFDTEKFSRDLLTKRCVDLRISIHEAAKKIGISKPTLSRLENKHIPNPQSWYLCSKWLGKDMLEYIKTEEDGSL